MYRDDLILQGLATSATSTATLAKRTGLSPASVGRGLQRLMEAGQVFSPVRGRYRLTAAGEALLRPADGDPAGTPAHAAEPASEPRPVEPEPPAVPDGGQIGSDERGAAVQQPGAAGAAPADPLSRRFDWLALALGVVLALGGLALIRLGMAILAAHTAGLRPSAPPAKLTQPAAPPPFWLGVGPAW